MTNQNTPVGRLLEEFDTKMQEIGVRDLVVIVVDPDADFTRHLLRGNAAWRRVMLEDEVTALKKIAEMRMQPRLENEARHIRAENG